MDFTSVFSPIQRLLFYYYVYERKIEEDYMQPFTERVIQIIQAIPYGKVMTYGQIAAEAGSPRGARQVVRILHSMSEKYHLPWHRVVNIKGEIAIADDESRFLQQMLLEEEGISFGLHPIVDLSLYRYESESPESTDET